MNNKFDELTKSLAQSVTRRAALKNFGVGLAGMALACFGLANRAQAGGKRCVTDADCGSINAYCIDGHCLSLTACDYCVNVCRNTGGSTAWCKKHCKYVGAC